MQVNIKHKPLSNNYYQKNASIIGKKKERVKTRMYLGIPQSDEASSFDTVQLGGHAHCIPWWCKKLQTPTFK